MKYECFTQRVVTKQGYILGVGGICTPGYACKWKCTLDGLRDLEIMDCDLFAVDYVLARALKDISDETLLLVGATIQAETSQSGRTGGVLGSPRETICSAEGECDQLPNGFSMYTVPGGPGLLACAPARVVESVWKQISGCTMHGAEKGILNILEAAHLDTGLLVFDGSGEGACGYILAFADGRKEAISLAESGG